MRVKLKNNQQGFSLVELLVTMIVMSILSLTLANFIATWLQTASTTQARADLLTNAESALDTIANDIRLSGSVDQNNRWADNYSPSGQYGWQSSGTVLVLAKVATDNSNNILFSDAAKYISQKDNEIYFVSGSTLYRRTLASSDATDSAITTCPSANATASCPADKVVATNVASFGLTYYDADENVVTAANARSVEAAITISTTKSGKQVSASYTTRMVFRNE